MSISKSTSEAQLPEPLAIVTYGDCSVDCNGWVDVLRKLGAGHGQDMGRGQAAAHQPAPTCVCWLTRCWCICGCLLMLHTQAAQTEPHPPTMQHLTAPTRAWATVSCLSINKRSTARDNTAHLAMVCVADRF
jgi:hypothetical protein